MATPNKYNYQKYKAVDAYVSRCVANGKLATIDGLALALDVEDDTILNWRKKDKRFNNSINKLMRTQRDQLINQSITRKWDPRFCQFLLSVNHGMAEAKKTIHDVEEQTVARMKELHDILEDFAGDSK